MSSRPALAPQVAGAGAATQNYRMTETEINSTDIPNIGGARLLRRYAPRNDSIEDDKPVLTRFSIYYQLYFIP
jgi:hypothetical protein